MEINQQTKEEEEEKSGLEGAFNIHWWWHIVSNFIPFLLSYFLELLWKLRSGLCFLGITFVNKELPI